ncbi:Exosome component 10 [Lamellibrachia satsuma]|nr:Exosome component 10 [Lamellibrachia satsuma]
MDGRSSSRKQESMADGGPDEVGSSKNVDPDDTDNVIPGFKDVNAFSKTALQAAMLATKCSNGLPSVGDDFDYYSSFESFRQLMHVEGERILQIIQQIMRYHGAKGNLSTSSEAVELDDKFDVLVDANDQVLEWVGTWLDEASGLKRDKPLIMATATPKQPVASWNRKTPTVTTASKRVPYCLLAARNIQRPQLKFKDTIDNSSRPFVPKLKEKYNAQKSLAESLLCDIVEGTVTDTTDESLCYPHPYQYELDQFQPCDHQMKMVEPQTPAAVEVTPLTLIDTEEGLQKLCEQLKKETEIAVDLEHHSYRTFLGITCLMQISTRTQDYLVDTLMLRSELHRLNDVFTDPAIIKVFHGADMDVEWLQRDLGLYVVNMFDTGQASRVLGLPRHGLGFLLAHYCGVQADKQFQMADWRIRPLPEELIMYAREDTHYLMYIYDTMKNELLERGNEHNNLLQAVLTRSKQICAKAVLTRSKQICAKVYRKPILRDDSYLELYRRSKKQFSSRQLEALLGIYAWRDGVARMEDESIGYVLPNHMMLQVAELLPREPQGILACCNPIPPLVKQNLNELMIIIKAAREKPLAKMSPARPQLKPSKQHHPKYDVSSLLHCPHDTSHVDTMTSDDNTAAGKAATSTSQCTVFGEKRSNKLATAKGHDRAGLPPVQICETAILCALVNMPQRTTRSSGAAHRKAAAIHAAFVSPFAKYLPPELTKPCGAPKMSTSSKVTLASKLDETQGKDLDTETSAWKLLPNTVKPPKPAVKPVERTTAPMKVGSAQKLSVDVIDVDEEEEVLPVRQQMSRSKRPHSGKETLASSETRKSKQRRSDEQFEDFEAHDYSGADMNMFQSGTSGGKNRDRKQYDPNKLGQEPKFRGNAKARLKPGVGKKSQTFGRQSGSSAPKIHWPKR